MIRVGLTGGIGTGKTHCLSRFASLGAAVIDADVLAREAVAPGSAALEAIAKRFGAGVLQADGSLDRAGLARIIFRDGAARADLEAIVHPEVYHRIRTWVANLPPGSRVAIADVPLLFETGHQHDFDRVIVCACDPAEQIRRVMARDGLTRPEAQARLDAQWPIHEKAARADHVIRTDGTFAETDEEIKRVFDALDAAA